MTPRSAVKPPRERILDAAFEVMRSLGLANATTKQIALHAGYSEAMLYKHFADKQELFLAVLQERLPAATIPTAIIGRGDLTENLTELVDELMGFFVTGFPIAASVFSSPELLRHHRDRVLALGFGPRTPVEAINRYLEAEQAGGRIAASADCAAAAQILVGAAFHQGFLAAFDGKDAVENSHQIALGIARNVSRSLL